ncbi:branched-chain amino acid aminotransferase [Phanerochaete sordida]|uniref:Branched-chain-amino-acid aminotransferase n=1 Tax=Phanerochaete sordida TaxID=48140 RepID=A0A9P3GMC1_9APHY|nr:branched-chain amino acid aminotransferase [Phanerochaete sordida]
MANGSEGNGHAVRAEPLPAPLDASKLTITLADTLKPIPAAEDLVFGKHMSDHMMVSTYHPVTGWSAPEIKPYGPFVLDPVSSCFQYSTNLFEGMKAYINPEGKPQLFRPDMNMARMRRSRDRVALPAFDTDELLKLIQKLVAVEQRWIPNAPGHSLYVRPTIIGTRPSLGVAPSDHAILYVVCCPTGPFFRVSRMLSLMAVAEHVRSWPGGTGGYKLAGNYAPTFMPQAEAAKKGYDQVLWCIGDKITEAGAMNFFVSIRRDDGDIDVYTPPNDGLILPGVTRDSIMRLMSAHGTSTTLAGIAEKLHVAEREIHIADIARWAAEGRLLEVFTVGTAVVVASVGRIGVEGKPDLELPKHDGQMGPLARAVHTKLTNIQWGHEQFEGWSVVCE